MAQNGITDFFTRNSEKQEVKKISKKIALENEIMGKLAQYQEKDTEVLFCALRKYLATYLPYPADSGYVGIVDLNYPDLYYCGDILVHSSKAGLKIGDVLHFRQYSSEGFHLLHGRIKSFDKGGNILVQGSDGEEGFIVGEMILGVLVEVIPFKEGKWEKLFDGLIGDYEWLKGMFKESIEFYKSNNEIAAERKNKVIPELERRLREL
jgi:hypothetical protein